MARDDSGRAEQVRRQSQAEKRLRGHRIRHGLEELGDLDAPAPAEKKPRKVAPRALPSSSSRATPVDVDFVDASATSFPSSKRCYESVFGDGWAAWREVKELLFSPHATIAGRRAALAEIRLWHARVRRHRVLPPYVEATELLMHCVLNDEEAGIAADASSTSVPVATASVPAPHTLATAYGAAIARTVHVMTGSFTLGEATTYRKRARAIGYPEEAVEVRQRVAHSAELPSLSELRWTCGLVLQFLFQQYWVEQERQLRLMGETYETGKGSAEAGRDNAKRASAAKSVSVTTAAAPSASVEEMESLLAMLESDDETAVNRSDSVRAGREASASAEDASSRFAGGWTIA